MNLNENRRCEMFEIDDDPAIYEMLDRFAQDLFEKAPPGPVEARATVDPVFEALFGKELDPLVKLLAEVRSRMGER